MKNTPTKILIVINVILIGKMVFDFLFNSVGIFQAIFVALFAFGTLVYIGDEAIRTGKVDRPEKYKRNIKDKK